MQDITLFEMTTAPEDLEDPKRRLAQAIPRRRYWYHSGAASSRKRFSRPRSAWRGDVSPICVFLRRKKQVATLRHLNNRQFLLTRYGAVSATCKVSHLHGASAVSAIELQDKARYHSLPLSIHSNITQETKENP